MVPTSAIIEATSRIGEARDLLDRALALLQRGREQAQTEDLGAQVLAEVLQRGASVSKEELYAIAEKHGMDRRGLGGFFRQSGKTSLYVLPTDRVVLTPYGADQARRLLERGSNIVYDDEPTNAYARVAEKSFAEDWDSDEDSVYDSV